jgi:hypothetical protein
MLRLGTIASLISMGRAALSPNDVLFHRLITSIAVAVGLAFLVAMLIGTAIVGGLYFLDYLLVESGVEPTTTFLILGAVLLLFIAAFVAACLHYLQKLRALSRHLFTTSSPLPDRVSNIADAFMAGLKHEPRLVNRF